MRRDVISAYAASGAKVLSWVIVSAVLFRVDAVQYALFALIRGTVGLLSYTTLGLAPAMIRLLTTAKAGTRHPFPESSPTPADNVLSYESAQVRDSTIDARVRAVFASGLVLAAITGIVGLALAAVYGMAFRRLHDVPMPLFFEANWIAWLIGAGVVLRLVSEACGGVVQVERSVTRDNLLVIGSEVAWVTLFAVFTLRPGSMAYHAATAFAVAGALLLLARFAEASRAILLKLSDFARANLDTIGRLLAIGGLVSVAQLADFLYAPTDYILINRLISADAVAIYAPAVQLDAGLLLLVSALAAVLLPKAASAHASGDHATLRRYYLGGTFISFSLLVVGAIHVYLLSGWIFQLWLGDPLPATQAILPLVLIHTVVGGSAGVGRSILLGMGKVKPFAVAAIVAGVANVVLSYVFVKYFGLGLKGIVYGTILAVVGRCVVWQPWYVLRTLKRESLAKTNLGDDAAMTVPPPEPL